MTTLKCLILVSAFCLLVSLTVAQKSYTPKYGNDYPEEEEYKYEEKYYEKEEEKYYEEEYKQEEKYYEEENKSYYTPKTYDYTEKQYEEEYQEYEQENYNYDNGQYGGKQEDYGQANNSYGGSSGYSGQYDSGSSTSTPKFPTSLLTGFVVDIHFLAVDIHFQYIAYHYCSDLFPGYTQCAIYNGTDSNSRLVATEIVVSEEILLTLPVAERKLYHSHAFAVKNGLLVLPGVPADQEEEVYKGVMSTYGKVVDYWHSFDNFPLGPPRLAYGIAEESQINATVADELDASLKLSNSWKDRQAQRKDWELPQKPEGVDDYLTSGQYPQYVIQQFKVDQE